MKASRSQSEFAAGVFACVEEVNKRFLADFALYGMRREISQSLFYKAQEHDQHNEEAEEEASKDCAVSFTFLSSER